MVSALLVGHTKGSVVRVVISPLGIMADNGVLLLFWELNCRTNFGIAHGCTRKGR